MMEHVAYPPVWINFCLTYDEAVVATALNHLLDAVGGLDRLTEGMTVGIKANPVSAMKPNEAATTHPALLCALTRILKEKGAGKVIVGDSLGGLYTSAFVNHVYDGIGDA